MNKHASNVWKAWADDRPVQILISAVSIWKRNRNGEMWKDYDPSKAEESIQPHFRPDLWRIKPDTKTFPLRFKVAIFNDSGWPMCKVVDSGLYEHFEKREDFVCWACDQQNINVTL